MAAINVTPGRKHILCTEGNFRLYDTHSAESGRRAALARGAGVRAALRPPRPRRRSPARPGAGAGLQGAGFPGTPLQLRLCGSTANFLKRQIVEIEVTVLL